MENHTTTEGDSHGLSPEPAGSKPTDGDRRCHVCNGRGEYLGNMNGDQFKCGNCAGSGVEPSVASRPGSSLFSPPAPSPLLEGRRAALTDAESLLVQRWRNREAALARYMPNVTVAGARELFDADAELIEAASIVAQSLAVRAEGGLNVPDQR